jgi:BRCT domain type II-containing protein
MDQDMLKQLMSELGKKGGTARARAMTAKERKASATKASKAAAAARTKKARERKKGQK